LRELFENKKGGRFGGHSAPPDSLAIFKGLLLKRGDRGEEK